MKITFTIIISLILFISSSSLAQPGSLDTSFDPGMGVDGSNSPGVFATSIQSDGKIIIGGYFSIYNGIARNNIIRVNIDGSLDNSFFTGSGASGDVLSTAIQSDGKIIICGNFSNYNGTSRNDVARLNTDGSLDPSFAPASGTSSTILSVIIQSDGKIIIGGHFSSYNGIARNRIARLNTDGSLDTTFNPGTGANAYIETISIQGNGKIIIGGNFTSFNGITRDRIARLNTDGSLDTSFDPGMGANHIIKSTSIQNDGKIIIGGYFTSYNAMPRNRIARLNTDGSLDNSFDPGTGAVGGGSASVNSISIQNDGKIIIAGQFNNYDGTARTNIARLNTDGSLDASFAAGGGPSSIIWTTSIQSDGKIIVGGWFTFYYGTPRSRIARINNTLTIGIGDLENGMNHAYVFPNPLIKADILHSNVELKNATLSIFNLSGQSLLKIENIYGNSIDLNHENLPAGLYFIQLLQDDQMILCDKLVIVN